MGGYFSSRHIHFAAFLLKARGSWVICDMEWRHRIVSLFINVDGDKDTNNLQTCAFFLQEKKSFMHKKGGCHAKIPVKHHT